MFPIINYELDQKFAKEATKSIDWNSKYDIIYNLATYLISTGDIRKKD